jgi:DNA polymerase-3 subunit beta
LPAADFPRVEVDQWETTLQVPQAALHRLLEKTAFAMAQQDVRYYLNGLLLEVDGNQARAVATDGHRLAKSEITLAAPVSERRQAIVPRKAIMELVRFLGDGEQDVAVEMNPNHIRVETGAMVFTSKLIDGRFPDYDKVIPAGLDIHVMIGRTDFHDLLARTAILTNEKFRGVRIALTSEKMTVSAHNPDQEEALDEMPVAYQGDEVEIGFNVGYLMDALKALDSEEIDFGVQDPNSSCTLTAPNDATTLYLVMPMRL